MADLPPADQVLRLPDGRGVAYDDRGDPEGEAVLFLHGTPDTRLARHPDDSICADRGLRLVAVDRPGLGDSDSDPAATPWSVATDQVALLDHLDVTRAHIVAWSAGAIFATALAGAHPDRVASLTLVAPLVPIDAYDAAGVLDGADASRGMFAELAPTMTPDEAGRELAMWLVPPEITEDLARDMLASSLTAVAEVTGADHALIAALMGSVARGMTGLEREIAAQATPLDELLDAVSTTVTVHVGDLDTVCPPAMGGWYADRLGAELVTHRRSGHAIGITAWSEVVSAIPR